VRSRAASTVLGIALALAGCAGDDDGGGGAGAPASTELVVELAELNGSGQTGTATLTPSGDGTMVTVETVSYLVDPQPVAVYRGTCADRGEQAYELATIEDGISVTTLDVPLADLQGGGYAVDVAESRAKPDVRVACGEIG
jgi:hypothetical protein